MLRKRHGAVCVIPKISWLWLVWLPVAAAVALLLRRRQMSWGQVVVGVFLCTYAVWIASVALVPAGAWASASGQAGRLSVNLIPFHTIINTLHIYWKQVVRQLGGNLLLFAPFTILLPAFWPRCRSWGTALALGVGGSLFIEVVQLLLSLAVGHPYRSVDIDDVILNTAGAALGYALFVAGRQVMELRSKRLA